MSRPDEGNMAFRIRVIEADDAPWMRKLLGERWGSSTIITRGRFHQADQLPGFIADSAGACFGLVTYRIEGNQCEVVSLDSLREGVGIGSALLDAVQAAAREAGCRRIWLITTNDNLAAIRFYQKRGWRLVAVYREALAESRKLKPEIPRIGIDGIPLRDEIELELPP